MLGCYSLRVIKPFHMQVDLQYLDSNISEVKLPMVNLTLSSTTRGVLLVSAAELSKAGIYQANFSQVGDHGPTPCTLV